MQICFNIRSCYNWDIEYFLGVLFCNHVQVDLVSIHLCNLKVSTSTYICAQLSLSMCFAIELMRGCCSWGIQFQNKEIKHNSYVQQHLNSHSIFEEISRVSLSNQCSILNTTLVGCSYMPFFLKQHIYIGNYFLKSVRSRLVRKSLMIIVMLMVHGINSFQLMRSYLRKF